MDSPAGTGRTPKTARGRRTRDKLLQAVRNLIDNCLKYTPEGGQVTITGARIAGGRAHWKACACNL